MFILLTFTMPVFAGQGLTCGEFRKFPEKEQRRYLEGYTLGAAMELSFFKQNVLTVNVGKALDKSTDDLLKEVGEWGMEYLNEKYDLLNIAVGYPEDFYKAIQLCASTPGAGMFEVLPLTLKKMQKTGKYPIWGM
jgi:hypothetical protein